VATVEEWLAGAAAAELSGKVNLLLTSPPFPLNRQKSYGNLTGLDYVDWLAGLAPRFATLLAVDGSLVIEIGNAWEPGRPTMSTLPVEALLALKRRGDLHLCQEFVVHNPARLPTPVQYVNVERVRVKDSWTRVWWLSRTPRPKANNRRVQVPYSESMRKLLERGAYNAGPRPSEHHIGEKSFLTDNGGAIPPSGLSQAVLDHFGSFLVCGNTTSNGDPYQEYCRRHGLTPHPARMQPGVVGFFVSFLTDPGDLVLDPFAGSNTTGWVAERLGRRWAAVELNPGHARPSRARFAGAPGDLQAAAGRGPTRSRRDMSDGR
jgi:site-specific DNA-methyltransferase (cytosine-N4-specific)